MEEEGFRLAIKMYQYTVTNNMKHENFQLIRLRLGEMGLCYSTVHILQWRNYLASFCHRYQPYGGTARVKDNDSLIVS